MSQKLKLLRNYAFNHLTIILTSNWRIFFSYVKLLFFEVYNQYSVDFEQFKRSCHYNRVDKALPHKVLISQEQHSQNQRYSLHEIASAAAGLWPSHNTHFHCMDKRPMVSLK